MGDASSPFAAASAAITRALEEAQHALAEAEEREEQASREREHLQADRKALESDRRAFEEERYGESGMLGRSWVGSRLVKCLLNGEFLLCSRWGSGRMRGNREKGRRVGEERQEMHRVVGGCG